MPGSIRFKLALQTKFCVESASIVAVQLDNHLTDHQLHAKMQSAYRKYHSTESALLKVFDDINTTIDNQHECVLVLLDLSATFDTIDHKIPIIKAIEE